MTQRKSFSDNTPEREKKNFRLTVLSSFLCQKFAFATVGQKILLVFGMLFAAITGVCLPLIILLFADLVTVFIQYQLKKEDKVANSYFQEFWENHMRFTFFKQEEFLLNSKYLGGVIELYAIEISFLGIIIFIFSFAYTSILNYVAEKQMVKLKIRYLSAVLKQPSDRTVTYDVYVKAHRNLQRFSTSLGDNFGIMILSFSVFMTSIVIAFLNHLILTSMLIVLFAVLSIILFFSVVIYRYLNDTEKSHYQIAENLAKDIFLNIQSVKAYEGEAIELRRFDKLLATSQTAGVNTWMFFGFVIGLLYILLYTSYALTFWQGMSMALERKTMNETPDILIIVNFCIQICFVNFLKIPIFVIITKRSTVAFEEMTSVIRKAEHENSLKKTQNQLINDITFTSVYFTYSTDEKPLLNNINVQIPIYALTCVVGAPKSGKSTFLKLLVKLQKVKEGTIQVGKININEVKDSWLRNRIGYVPQKTVLFGDTIRDAIRGNSDSDSDLISVCRMVNVHSYIINLQQGYDTPLNSDLTDEVKEKLAIARILMNNPDILILDNCMNNINVFTQMAIITEFLSQSRKTAIVATSKLDIIKSSDLVLYFKNGELDTGTYSQFMAENAKFRSIIERAELDKTATDFGPGVPEMKIHSHRSLGRNDIGLSTAEMLANEVTVTRILKPEWKEELKTINDKAEPELINKSKKKINCWKVLTLNKREFAYLTTAAVAATVMGFSVPAYATLFGESLGTIVLNSKSEIEDNINFFPQMFLVAGLISGIAKMVEGYMIAVACSKLTKRLRKQTFEALIHKDVAFYDKDENHMSALLNLLREDARIVPLAAGPEMVLFIKVGGIIIISTLVSVYHSWKLGLVVLAFSPFLFYGLYYLSRFQTSGVYDDRYKEANEYFHNLLKYAETLQTLNLVDHYMTHYKELCTSRTRACVYSMKMKALLFSYSQSIPYFAYAVCMLYGGILLRDDEITFTNFFKVLESLILGTVLLSQVLMVIPSRQSCLVSCAKLLELIPSKSERNLSLTKSRFELGNYVTVGYVKMKHISFVHPNNSFVPRLHDINLQINERQTIIALTGLLSSGCSLPIKLLNQFYKPTAGSIMIDDFDISREFSLKTLRRNVGLVDGRDRFFRRTVARNISYSVNNSRDVIESYVGMDDIVSVAKEADIHNFIITLPEGYYTIMTEEVRRKMTPGQVLRLSLARALLRDPRLLLIENIGIEVDEDAHVLMETAIIKAAFSRTVILASSFLLSVSNIADFIYFFEGGYIKEFGKHQKLMEKQGPYYKLYEQQREQLHRMRESRLLGIEED